MDLISVIIPVYNTEKYLDKCIESVVNQSYKNLEIILVDDGSTDSCPVKCDKWAEKDIRVKVIHKKNGGQGEARNYGIESSSGDYIGFVDSDDIIHPAMYERLLKGLKDSKADMIQCKMFKYDEFPLDKFPELNKENIRCFNSADAVKGLLQSELITSTCPSVLIKYSIAKRVIFDTDMINEDVMWIYRALHNSERIAVSDEKLYGYYQRIGSTMNSDYSFKKFDAIKAIRMRADSVKSDYPDLFPLAEKTFVGLSMYHYQWLCRLPKSDEYESYKKRHYDNFINADLKSVFSVTDLKYKIWYTLFKLFPDFTCNIRNSFKIGL